jgi:hypothetical protein
LRVFRLQTLEINSVVKDSTYLDPSLVSGVKDSTYLDPSLVPGVQYSSHTILHQVLVISISREGDRVQLWVISSRGHTIWRRSIRSKERRRSLGKRTYGFSLYSLRNPIWAIVEEISLLYYLLELRMSWREGGHTAY